MTDQTVTIRILDGPDKGLIYKDLPLPVTLGREEGASIQLSDEQVSRCHARIQFTEGELFITDISSTNGTRVNGENISVALLHPGDVVIIGASVMLIGSRREIIDRIRQLKTETYGGDLLGAAIADDDYSDMPPETLEAELSWVKELSSAVKNGVVVKTPGLPAGLSPVQLAKLSDVLQYLHVRMRSVVENTKSQSAWEQDDIDSTDGNMVVPLSQWQNLVDLYDIIGRYLFKIGEPEA